MIGLRLLGIGALCSFGATCLSGCSGSSNPPTVLSSVSSGFHGSPQQLLDTALKDAVAEGWVRDVSRYTQGSQTSLGYTDEGIGSGRELIRSGKARAEIIEAGGHAFIHANGAGILRIFGFPKADETRLSDRWMSVSAFNPIFSALIQDVTVESDVTDSLPVGKLTLRDTRSDGVNVAAITGRPPKREDAPRGATETLYVSTGADPLPIRETGTAPDGSTGTTTFSRWGEPTKIKPPAHATPLSKILPGY